MNWKWSDPLRKGMVDMPFIGIQQTDLPESVVGRMPTVADMEKAFPGKNHSLKTWGRTPGTKVLDPHWIGLSGQGPLHFDPGYPRYTHHLLLIIDPKFVLRGYSKEEVELSSGLYFCMDGHSPHQLYAKKRGAKWYLAVSIDSHEVLPKDETLEKLIQYASSAPFFAPDLEIADA